MSTRYILVLLSLLVLALAACSTVPGDETDPLTEGYTFRSIDEIVEEPLQVANFAPDGSASLPIVTTVPVACTIVYGQTPAFGSLSLDLDMQGGTHSDHNPLLTGLAPETEYFFRVQGIDEDGVVYLSEVMTFTTPAADETPVSDNLASAANGGQVIGYSSAFGDAAPDARWGVAGAFDDNPNTQWSSDGDGDDAWAEVELAGPARIDSVSFQSRAMSDGSAITLAFSVVTDSGQEYGPFELPDADSIYDFEVSFEARTLRFNLIKTTGGNTGVVDIAVYGEFIEP